MQPHKTLSVLLLFLSLQCHDVLAACNLSSWHFQMYQPVQIMGITIGNGASQASGTLINQQITNANNMSSPWSLSPKGAVGTQSIGSGSTVRLTGVPSSLTAADSSCNIQIKPVMDGTTHTVNQSGSYQLDLDFAVDFIIPAGCPRGGYMGWVNMEVYVVDPVNCPEGGTVQSENFQAIVEIVNIESVSATIALNNREDLSFGSFLSPQVAGQVEVSATSDTPSYISIFKVDSSSAHRGQMEVTGTPGTQYSLMMPQTEITLHSGGNSLRLSNMTMMHQNTGQVGTQYQNISIGGSGTDIVYVGGRLEVPARAAAGEYTGTYTVQLSY